MQALECFLWLLFLGAALASPLYWLAQRRAIHDRVNTRPAEPGEAESILFLTPACRRALGTCAAPMRLRRMNAKDIGNRLGRASFEPPEQMPLPGQYGSWPRQAELLCDGDGEGLARLQRELREEFSEARPAPRPPESYPPERGSRRGLRLLLALMLAFLILSLLAWLLMPKCRDEASCNTVENPVTISQFDLSSDLVFDYNQDEPITPYHGARLKDRLRELFSQHDEIEIVSIQGHTDPIGSTIDNQRLGARRAAYVRDMIVQLMAEHAKEGKFIGYKELVGPTDNGPNKDDFEIWSACFTKFQLNPLKAGHSTPLTDLRPSKNDGRVPCEQAGPEVGTDGRFPACARMKLPGPRDKLKASYAERVERLHQMIACLAPMRHVELRFKSRRVQVGAGPNEGGKQ